MCNPARFHSREELLRFVWATGGGGRRCSHRRRSCAALREKIEPSPSDPKYVHTKWGVGIISGFGNVEKELRRG